MPTGEPRSQFARLAADTLRRPTAMLGLAWVILLAAVAVLAPVLANSHPILFRNAEGQWSSPMLRHLAPVDVILLATGAAALVMFGLVRGMPASRRLLTVLWFAAVITPFASWAVVTRWLADMLRPDAGDSPVLLGWALIVTTLAVLVIAALIVGLPLTLRLGRGGWAVLLVAVAILGGMMIAFPVEPPLTVVHSQYRVAKAANPDRVVMITALIPYSPTDRFRDRTGEDARPPLRPSAMHWMGTERNGADILSRMIHASRIAISIGFISTGIALVIGVIIGGLMGYFSGIVDILGMRLVEIFSAIPTLFLLLAFVAFFPRNIYIMMAIIGLTSWVGYAIFIRAEFLRLRQQEFVQAALAQGLPLWSILFRHMLPNGVAPVLVSASFGVASAILAETTLSFLGLGLVDEPSWGELLSQAVGAGGDFYWWIGMFPGLAIFFTVFAYNLVGEALRDAIDPTLRKQGSE